MCGIVGYIGKRDSVPILMDSLARLEYRGYDSAGIAVIDDGGRLTGSKAEGKLATLAARPSARPSWRWNYHIAIMHKPKLPPIPIHPVAVAALAATPASARRWRSNKASFAGRARSGSAQL